MYADRYTKQKKLDPASLGLSALLVGGIMTGMIFSAPDFVKKIQDGGIDVVNIALPPEPPLNPPPPKTPEVVKADPLTRITPTDTIVKIDAPPVFTVDSSPLRSDLTEGTTSGTAGEILTVPPKPPVVVGPGINPRFNYQPDYPSDERRLGREGRVVVRVLVGTDGRVKQVEKVSAASDSFFEATRRRALEKWRLTPGTRDGVAVEAWRTMAVSFVMNDE